MREMSWVLGLTLLLCGCTPDVADQGRAVGREIVETTDPSMPSLERLGIGTRSVADRSAARRLELPRVIRGAYVSRVIPRTPAARAGLKRGDVITEIRVGKGADEVGHSVESSADLESVLMRLTSVDALTVEVFRGPAPPNRSSYATELFRVWLRHK